MGIDILDAIGEGDVAEDIDPVFGRAVFAVFAGPGLEGVDEILATLGDVEARGVVGSEGSVFVEGEPVVYDADAFGDGFAGGGFEVEVHAVGALLDEGADAFLRHGGGVAVAAVHPAFFDLGNVVGFLGGLDDGFVFFEAEPAAGFLGGAGAAVFELAIGFSPGAGVADAFDVFELIGPFAEDPAAVVGSEANPKHGPGFSLGRIDKMIDGAVGGNFVVGDDMDGVSEFWKHGELGAGGDSVGSHEDAFAVAASEFGLHGLGVAEGVVGGVEIDDAGFFPDALLDAGDALDAFEFAVAVAGEERGFGFLQGFCAVEVFFDGAGVAFDRCEADAEFAVAGDEAEAEGFKPVGRDQLVGPGEIQFGAFDGGDIHGVEFEPALAAIRQDE